MSIAFYLEARLNAGLAGWCVGNVRSAYPGARITLFSDGDPDPAYQDLGRAHGAEVVYGERLWGEGAKAGALWMRRLSHFAAAPRDFFVKMDTDTGLYRPLSYLPDRECLFGTVWKPPKPFVTGGFMGMTRSAVDKVHRAGSSDPDFMAAYAAGVEDRALSAVASRLGIALHDHPEVASRWKVRMPNPDLRYAVVHPCKDGRL